MFLTDTEGKPELRRELDAPHRLLLKAADYIEKHGWCQNYVGDAGGQACIEGAICIADGRSPMANLIGDRFTAASIFRRAVGMDAFRWNDQRGRTKEEVVAKLRAVALGG